MTEEKATLPAVGKPVIDVALVRRLVDTQLPQWRELPITGVEFDGWDNRTFRLGSEMTVRLPSADGYAAQVDKEQRWLPVLAPQLPLPIPVPLARGGPGGGYPYGWSVYRWLEGEIVRRDRVADPEDFAVRLAEFLVALQQIDATGGPEPSWDNFFRGGPLLTYDAETRQSLVALEGQIPVDSAAAVWETALAATWTDQPVWFHGDVAEGNLLLRDGTLAAVLDFGCCGVGDPACDLAIAWTLLRGRSRDVFRTTLAVDDGTWARGRGWVLWKALITLAGTFDINPNAAVVARATLDEVLADAERS
jgi:aminoglycoside phosphotransferase (APT) family kinase protein